jgi:signal peptidase I
MGPFGLLYVARPWFATAYFLLVVVIVVASMFVLRRIELFADVAVTIVAVTCAIHAYQLARSHEESRARPRYSRWYGLLGVVTTLAVLTAGTRAFLYEPFRFPSASMAPSIEPRAHLIVKKWGYGNYKAYGIQVLKVGISADLRRGDIVVFEFPEDPSLYYAKRVVGLPGDRVSYSKKRLKINDKDIPIRQVGEYSFKDRPVRLLHYLEQLDGREHSILLEPGAPSMPFARHFPLKERCTYSLEGDSCQVPQGHYYVLGDNRDNSNDSRMWGFVPERNIVGKVQYIVQ